MSYKIIDKAALVRNFNILKEQSKSDLFCAVVKANAYGHGVEQVVRILHRKVDYFAVASIDEAKEIVSFKLKHEKPILILSPVEDPIILRNVEFTVASLDDIIRLEKLHKKVFVHIKIDTGMNRFGCDLGIARKIVMKIKKCKFVRLRGIFTHFSFAENDNVLSFQKEKFVNIVSSLNLSQDTIIHGGNTVATLKGLGFTMCRCGIGLYGFGNDKLEPILSIYSTIMEINEVKQGEYVGYNQNFLSPSKMKIAVVKIGYADGYERSFNYGYVKIRNQYCKIVGDICMDCLFCDVSRLKKVQVGDEVCVLSNELRADEIAKRVGKISYEIVCGFNKMR